LVTLTTWLTVPSIFTTAVIAAWYLALVMSALVVANTTWVEAPEAAGSLDSRELVTCWASVPGMVTELLVLPPLSEEIATVAMTKTNQAARAAQCLRKHQRASRYRYVDKAGSSSAVFGEW
jgi:hypothetical protein